MTQHGFISLDMLPENGRVAIYGSGAAALAVLECIRAGRPDVTVPFFLDSFNAGEAGGLKVLKKDALPDIQGEYDYILIASAWWRDIGPGLDEMGVTEWGVASEAMWHKYVYSEQDMARAKGGIDAVDAMLATEQDKAVYRLMVDARKEGSPLVEIDATNPKFVDYLMIKDSVFDHLTEQYIDFVVREPVKTILHAGVFDGTDCTKFLRTFPNVEAIHGFEPQGEERIKPETLDEIIRSGKVHIHQKGLWNTTESVPLIGSGGYMTLAPDAASAQITGRIETTSIDEFVAEHGVESVDFLCLDVEGAEERALHGARKTIASHRLQLAVCIYHKKEDIFRLPLLMDEMLDDYVYHIGHYCSYLNETVLYAIPRELEEG